MKRNRWSNSQKNIHERRPSIDKHHLAIIHTKGTLRKALELEQTKRNDLERNPSKNSKTKLRMVYHSVKILREAPKDISLGTSLQDDMGRVGKGKIRVGKMNVRCTPFFPLEF